MLGDGFYNNDLITFPQAEKGNGLDVYCRLEGLDFQQLASESPYKKLLSILKRKNDKNRPAVHTIKQ
ncbi:MAG: hypothetical protein GX279_12920 [Clostridiaceae bacterium]|jgi:hypothetical protein|nr:hypothetical protein [Clostridiaceae bacterium]